MPSFCRKVRGALWNLKGKNLGVLGLAFKGGTDDVRESRGDGGCAVAVREGCNLKVCDPVAREHAAEFWPKTGYLRFRPITQAAADSDALLILTEWAEFAALDLKKLHDQLSAPS